MDRACLTRLSVLGRPVARVGHVFVIHKPIALRPGVGDLFKQHPAGPLFKSLDPADEQTRVEMQSLEAHAAFNTPGQPKGREGPLRRRPVRLGHILNEALFDLLQGCPKPEADINSRHATPSRGRLGCVPRTGKPAPLEYLRFTV